MALKASSTNFDEAFCDVLYSIIHMYREKCSTDVVCHVRYKKLIIITTRETRGLHKRL